MRGFAVDRVVCVGGAFVDRKFHVSPPAPRGASSLCGRTVVSFGGVARNVAANLAGLGLYAELISVVGDDADGSALLDDLRAHGMGTAWVDRVDGAATAQYVAVLEPAGELRLELADTEIFEHFDVEQLQRARTALDAAAWVFVDGNAPATLIGALAADRRRRAYRLALDAVSVPKAALLPHDLTGVDMVFCNVAEAASYLAAHGVPSAATAGSMASAMRARGAGGVVVTDGAAGATIAERGTVRIPAAPVARIVDVTGAGDALVATALARLCAGDDLVAAVAAGTYAAARTIESEYTVRPHAPIARSAR